MFVSNAQLDFMLPDGNGGLTPDGDVAREMSRINFDAGLKRPYIAANGRAYCDVRKPNGKLVENKRTKKWEPEREAIPVDYLVQRGLVPPTFNATALTKDAWEKIDSRVITAARAPLQAWADLRAHSTYGGFDAMGVMGLTRHRITGASEATMSMQVSTQTHQDRPLYDPDVLPLPITQCGFEFDQRELAVSRNAGTPLDTTMAAEAGRAVGELIEKVTIGVTDLSTLVIGASTTYTRRGIYGYRTQPGRVTKTDVTASASWVASTFFSDVLAMIELARAQNMYGPFTLYYSTTWAQYIVRDYFSTVTAVGVVAPTKTAYDRVKELPQIRDIKPLQYFTNSDELLLIQWDDAIEAVNGMELTTVQWESQGGSMVHFRVMAIQVPAIRERYIGSSITTKYAPIVHGTTS